MQRFDLVLEQSRVDVLASSVMGSHRVRAHRFEGFVCFAARAPERSSVELSVDMHSLVASQSFLTDIVKGPKLLDVERFPEARFESTHVESGSSGGNFRVTGTMLLHGVKKDITVTLRVQRRASELKAASQFTLLRDDFDLEYKGMLEMFLAEEVTINLDISARRAAAKDGSCLREPGPQPASESGAP